MKKVLCYVLSMILVMSSIIIPEKEASALGNTTSLSQETTLRADAKVVAYLDGTVASQLPLYLNGVYEAKLNVTVGEHSLQVYGNGAILGEETKLTVPEGTTEVYVRYENGKVYNSITNPTEFHTASICGNFNGLQFVDDDQVRYDIGLWDPADANATIGYLGGGLYVRTFRFQELVEDVTLKDGGYKIAFDGGWNYSFGNGGDNISLTIPKGTDSLTILVDEINQVVYDSVRSGTVSVAQNNGTKEFQPIGLDVSIIGDVRMSESDNWDVKKEGYSFTQISDTLFTYQKVLQKGSYNYKVCFQKELWYEKGGNRSFTITEDDTTVVFVYDAATQELFDSVTEYNSVAVKLGLAEQPTKSQVIDQSNGTTRFVTTSAESENSTVKLVYGDAEEFKNPTTVTLHKGSTSSGAYNGSFASEDLFLGDEKINLAYYYEIDGKRVVDESEATVTIDGVKYASYTREAFIGRGVYVPGTFPGPSWDAKSNQMTYLGNGLYSHTFKEVPAANYQFKIAMGAWSENYGAGGKFDGSNYAVTLTKTRDVTVYYNDITTHLAVTDVNYIFADVTLTGANIPEGTKLLDTGLTGIYSITIPLEKGTYDDVRLVYNGKEFGMDPFTLEEGKKVTFYFDPVTEIYYNNSTIVEIDASEVVFDSKDTKYKSVFGAISENQDVNFAIRTGDNVSKVKLVVKGKENKSIDLTVREDGSSYLWDGKVTIDTYGQYEYFFVLYYGSYVKVYCDDDGYYGTGMLTDLTSLNPYDLVVYKEGFTTPDWMKDAVIYQIFPDRFFNGDLSNDDAQTSSRGEEGYEFITDWSTFPENPEQAILNPESYPENAFLGDGSWSNEIYGGDLRGIIERVEYLKALGVNVIYLNPVFSSISSHRYDTSDYTKIDPILGDLGDFKDLVKICEKYDMHLVLDGVFNHVSDDSVYFDRYYKFVGQEGKVGAYPFWAYVYDDISEHGTTLEEAKKNATTYFKGLGVTDFTYTEWFDIYTTTLKDEDGNVVKDEIGDRAGKEVYNYDGWWGYDSMPVVKSTNGSEYQTASWANEIIDGKDSVCNYWLIQGADGWRLDVANEVSDETWQRFRESVKALDSEHVIIGEIWDEATQYLLGDMYDSVMNYVFRNAVLNFAKGGNASDSMKTLERIRELYPTEAFYAMMNLVGSHDTTRLLSYLDGIDDDRNQKEVEKAFPSYETTSDLAKQRQYLVAFLQMTYAGAPTLYYGDEIGMVGADDPDNRRAMTWGEGNKELVEWYATLASIRNAYSTLRTGSVEPVEVNEAVMAFVRKDGENTMLVLANNSTKDVVVTVPVEDLLEISKHTVTDLVSFTNYEVKDGVVEVVIPALRGIILSEQVKEVSVQLDALKPAYDKSYKVGSSLTGVVLDKKAVTVTVGEKITLSATLTPVNAADVSLQWSSDYPNIATVENGIVTAKAPGTTTIKVSVNGVVYSTCKVTVKAKEVVPPDSVTDLKVTKKTSSSLTLSWKKVKDATGYQVYRLTGSKWTLVKELTATTLTDSKLLWSTEYSYKVRAYKIADGKKVYGTYSKVVKATTTSIPKPSKVTGVKVKATSTTTATLTWKKQSNVTGYEIYMKTQSGSYKRIAVVKGANASSYKVTSLKEGYSYRFVVRAYKTEGGKTIYGSYSSSTSFRMSISKPTNLKITKRSSRKISLSWNKVKNVSGYIIYMQTGNGSYKKVGTVKNSSTFTKWSLKRGKTYRFKIKAYKVIDKKTYYSSFSTPKTITMK